VTPEGLIFRVLGYSHPPRAYVCDAEYAPAELFRSGNPKAPRSVNDRLFYKFYEDEGWKFIHHSFPQYTVFHDALQRRVVGVNENGVAEIRRPKEGLEKLAETAAKDELQAALQSVLHLMAQHSDLPRKDFGVFGSLLHGFYHPQLSDLDFVICGAGRLRELCETLKDLYADDSSRFGNEFQDDDSVKGKQWRFTNYSSKEYVFHQQRKKIYGLFRDKRSGRSTKMEFEPVKDSKEIGNEYDSSMRVFPRGWVSMTARITEDRNAPYMPSEYGVEPLKILKGSKEALGVKRVVSYVEEFRMQANRDEMVLVEGNLEEVVGPRENYLQIMLTYCPRYYDQVLKLASLK